MPDAQTSNSAPVPVGVLTDIVVDSANPVRAAEFWGKLLGLPLVEREERWAELAKLPGEIRFGFQLVPETKVVKNRLHVDVATANLETTFETAISLGARHLADVNSWRVMADPEGNEFCLESPRARVSSDANRLRAVGIDCKDGEHLAEFWAGVLGVRARRSQGPYTPLEPVPGGLRVYFQRVPEPKTVKNRIHLDVTPPDVDAATKQVEVLGGRAIEDIKTWRVMADPEGNEFCLLREE